MQYHNDTEFPFNAYYKIIDLTQGHMVCCVDDRDLVVRYFVMTNHIKN